LIGISPLTEYNPLCLDKKVCSPQEEYDRVFEEVRTAAYQIIERKGETSYGIGLAMARITQAIVDDENTVLPVSILAQDLYGVRDVYLSLPSVINKQGVREIMPPNLNQEEQKSFQASAAKLREVLEKFGF